MTETVSAAPTAASDALPPKISFVSLASREHGEDLWLIGRLRTDLDLRNLRLPITSQGRRRAG